MAELQMATIFPTVIARTTVDYDRNTVIEVLNDTPMLEHNILVKSSWGTMINCLDDERLAGLKEQATNAVVEYTKKLGLFAVKPVGSWFTVIGKGQGISRHRHPGSVVSGVIWIDLPEGSPDLEFWDPTNPLRMLEQPVMEHTLTAGATEGTLVLWPSWLEHQTIPSESEKPRISISFNCLYDNERIKNEE
jgi:hypothetical protein